MNTPVNIKKVPVDFVVKPKGEALEIKSAIQLKEKEIREKLEAELEEKRLLVEEELNQKLKEAEENYNKIIARANKEKEEMLNAIIEKEKIKYKEAYEKGYSQGKENGYEDGYKEAYEDNIDKAKIESSEIINSAQYTLTQAQETVVSYLKQNKDNIIGMILTISEKVLREKFSDVDSINSLVTSAIDEYELKKNFIVRINPIYKESLKEQIGALRATRKVESEVFILSDINLEKGNAVIETQNGKITVGIDSILERIKEELI